VAEPIPMLEAALKWAEAGVYVLPLDGKKSHIKGGYQSATRDPEEVRKFWTRFPNANIGGVCGPEQGLLVLDVDSAEGEAGLLVLCNGEIPRTRVHLTGRGRHLLFLHPGVPIKNRLPLLPGLDVKASGGYVVLPPSLHPERKVRYTIEDESVPIAELPRTILFALTQDAPKPLAEAASALSEDFVIETGGRNNFLLEHAGRLRGRVGLSPVLIRHVLLALNAVHCRPPLPESEVEAMAQRTATWMQGDGVVEDLNRQFAMVQVGGRMRVLKQDAEGDFTLFTPHDFAVLLQNQVVVDSTKKRRKVSEIWLTSPDRRQFSEIVFEPAPPYTTGAFNLFSGFGVQPGPGNCDLWLAHLRDVICSGNATIADWVTAWFSNIVQAPREKPGTAVALRGAQGTGKTLFGSLFGRLLGRHYVSIASTERLVGRFNSHMANALLVQGEEATWGGDRTGESTLKDMITGRTIWLEKKGIDPVEVNNFTRVLLTSNHQWMVPAGPEERRFCVLDVSESRMQQTSYFKALKNQMDEENGYAALLDFLLKLDIASIDLRQIPRTKALAEQKLASMTSPQKWWLDVLRSGQLPGDEDGIGAAPCAALHDSYVRHAQKVGYKRRASETELGLALNKLVPGLDKKRMEVRTVGGRVKKVPFYLLPPLRECRTAFSKIVQGADSWPNEDEGWLPPSEPAF
jgi:bifunctional DNA primase/polymerase-like protein/uncharacterized protein DUF5906/primase-like protein